MRITRISLGRAAFVAGLFHLATGVPVASQELPKEDLDFVVEHLFEVTMDHRFASMPTTAEAFEKGRWQWAVDGGWGGATARGLDVGGALFAATAGLGVAERRGVEMTAFFDRFSLSGSSGEQVLRPLWSTQIPLDLPQRAQVSGFGGDVTSWGVGATFVWQRSPAPTGRRWTWRAGAIYDRLEATNARARYRLISGASTGTVGEIDYSATYTYVVPFGEGEIRWPLGQRWEIAPHFAFFNPLPRRGFIGRITGPGFEVAGDTEKAKGLTPMGDPYLSLGVRLDHRRSGFGIDLGATAFQATTESIFHDGISQALLLRVSWQRRR